MAGTAPQRGTASPAAPVIVERIADVRAQVQAARQAGRRVGLVPTMGALHRGHVSLIEAARRTCDYVVVSVFVNPTQFGPHEDFHRYPRPFETDVAQCAAAGTDLIFHPSVEELYPDGFRTFVEVAGLSDVLEGAHRPGHFRGVATVVLKLFNIVAPDVAFFGQKDFQQQVVIRRFCRDLDVPVAIETCPTIREPDGLALSSRNAYLSPADRLTATALSRALFHARDRLRAGETDLAAIRREMHEILTADGQVDVDYATLVDPDTLAEAVAHQPRLVAITAARVGKTRLIDNVEVGNRE